MGLIFHKEWESFSHKFHRRKVGGTTTFSRGYFIDALVFLENSGQRVESEGCYFLVFVGLAVEDKNYWGRELRCVSLLAPACVRARALHCTECSSAATRSPSFYNRRKKLEKKSLLKILSQRVASFHRQNCHHARRSARVSSVSASQ